MRIQEKIKEIQTKIVKKQIKDTCGQAEIIINLELQNLKSDLKKKSFEEIHQYDLFSLMQIIINKCQEQLQQYCQINDFQEKAILETKKYITKYISKSLTEIGEILNDIKNEKENELYLLIKKEIDEILEPEKVLLLNDIRQNPSTDYNEIYKMVINHIQIRSEECLKKINKFVTTENMFNEVRKKASNYVSTQISSLKTEILERIERVTVENVQESLQMYKRKVDNVIQTETMNKRIEIESNYIINRAAFFENLHNQMKNNCENAIGFESINDERVKNEIREYIMQKLNEAMRILNEFFDEHIQNNIANKISSLKRIVDDTIASYTQRSLNNETDANNKIPIEQRIQELKNEIDCNLQSQIPQNEAVNSAIQEYIREKLYEFRNGIPKIAIPNIILPLCTIA